MERGVMRAFITGINGQDGAYLAQLLLNKGYEVYGSSRQSNLPSVRHEVLGIASKVNVLTIDPEDSTYGLASMLETKPDEVYHLAAQSSLTEADRYPIETAEINAMWPLRILEGVRKNLPSARVFLASSAQVFGGAFNGEVKAEGPFNPTNIYGATKLFGQLSGAAYRNSYDMFVSTGILFAHESPLRGKEFMTRKVTSVLAKVKLGLVEALEVGNLESRRDWGHARDFVNGMWLALQHSKAADYIFATGSDHSVRELIERACECYGIRLRWQGSGLDERGIDAVSNKTVVRINPAFYRPFADLTPLADISRTAAELGWEATTKFDDLISEMCRFDQSEAARG